ncbi:hypothetical protein GE09DRAFT_1282483 [Coniochaeta sp. 2T2.1]|nr:hypothetical protein GE09DRAFT_1282483 [Coniochaeta sp. 2T2.1]
MKFTTVIVSALASVAAAAPTKQVEERAFNFDLAGLNNLRNFNSLDLNYLGQVNNIDLQLLLALGQNQGLNLNGFNNLFQTNNFDLGALLQLQQLQTLLSIAGTGVFQGFDLSGFALDQQLLQLGLINNLNTFNLGGIIDQSLVPQITSIAQQFGGERTQPAANHSSLSLLSYEPHVITGESVETGLPVDIVTAEEERLQDGAASLP